MTLQLLAAPQVSYRPNTDVVTDKFITTLSKLSKADMGVVPAKRVLMAGVVYTRRLLTGADMYWSFSI